jgi:hypothetical protein
MAHGLWFLVVLLTGIASPQEESLPRAAAATQAAPAAGRTINWSEGMTLAVRVPIASPAREFMVTVSFPEDSLETAVTGWGNGELTAIPKRGLLFLRLVKKCEGQLNVVGASGTHYLLELRGVDAEDRDGHDTYVKIRKNEPPRVDPLPKRQAKRPSGAVELLQAMRLGLRPEGARILRAKRELAYESSAIEIRLLYVYEAQSYRGMVYEVRNSTPERQSVDVSRFRGKGTALVVTALKENVVAPKATTRLYAVTQKD